MKNAKNTWFGDFSWMWFSLRSSCPFWISVVVMWGTLASLPDHLSDSFSVQSWYLMLGHFAWILAWTTRTLSRNTLRAMPRRSSGSDRVPWFLGNGWGWGSGGSRVRVQGLWWGLGFRVFRVQGSWYEVKTMVSGLRSGFRVLDFGVRVRVVGFGVLESGHDVGFRSRWEFRGAMLKPSGVFCNCNNSYKGLIVGICVSSALPTTIIAILSQVFWKPQERWDIKSNLFSPGVVVLKNKSFSWGLLKGFGGRCAKIIFFILGDMVPETDVLEKEEEGRCSVWGTSPIIMTNTAGCFLFFFNFPWPGSHFQHNLPFKQMKGQEIVILGGSGGVGESSTSFDVARGVVPFGNSFDEHWALLSVIFLLKVYLFLMKKYGKSIQTLRKIARIVFENALFKVSSRLVFLSVSF